MRIIISPAKQMQVDTDSFTCKELPVFIDRTEVLMKWIQNVKGENISGRFKESQKEA